MGHNLSCSPSNAPSFTGVIVGLLVGDSNDQVSFHAHENMLRKRSNFFDAAMGKAWKEAADKRIRLPEDDPVIVQLYLQYLYTGKVHYVKTTSGAGLSNDSNLPEYVVLANLYVFCEKMQDTSAKNAIMDTLIWRMKEPLENGRRYTPIAEAVDIIYKGTMPGSPARELMIDTHVFRGWSMWIPKDPQRNNVEFLIDLTRAVLDTRDKPSCPSPSKLHIKTISYHEKVEK